MHVVTRSTLLVLVLALALGACASGGTDRGAAAEGAARIVPLEELPVRYQAAWAAWQKGDAAFELERAGVERDPALASFLVDNLVREMVRTYSRSGLARPGGEPGPFERAQADLVAFAPQSAPVLAELLRAPDGIVAFLAADRLVAIGAAAIPRVTPLLDDERAETRRRAAELLGRLPHAGAAEIEVQQALAARVERDPEWNVRAESARALGARGSRHDHRGFAAGVLLRALRDPDTAVATSAAAGLATLGERGALPRLVEALAYAAEQGQPAVLGAIERTLGVLAGDKRTRSLAEWRAYARP
ncbi:MAG: HEAT repeat domain-containing protein [Planctomycetota bacterium]|nr:HEAT repeat domain-containing protein [Planctomycetota bacterium]